VESQRLVVLGLIPVSLCFWINPHEQEEVASASLRPVGSTSRRPADEIVFFIGKDAHATVFAAR
jgi:hypothetical protein